MNNVTGRPSSTVKTRHRGPLERQVSLVMYHPEITPRWANQSVRTLAPRRTKSLRYLTDKVWSYIHHSTFIARSVTSVSGFVWEIVYKWNNSHRWVVRQTYFIMIKLIQRAFIYMWWFSLFSPLWHCVVNLTVLYAIVLQQIGHAVNSTLTIISKSATRWCSTNEQIIQDASQTEILSKLQLWTTFRIR